MKDDPLLARLGAAVRDDERAHAADLRWERLAEGALSADERHALERDALGDSTVEERLALYAPFDERSLAGFEEAARSAMSASPRARLVDGVGRRRVRWLAAVAAPLAAAAVLIFYLTSPSRPPVGAYDAIVASADVSTRSVGAAPPSGPAMQTGHGFELIARPDRVSKGVVARAFLERAGTITRWDAPLEVSAEGAVRIAGDTDALFGAADGAVTIVLAIGRPGAIPELPADVARGDGAAGPDARWRLVRKEIILGRR